MAKIQNSFEATDLTQKNVATTDFSFSIANSSGYDKVIALVPGYCNTEKIVLAGSPLAATIVKSDASEITAAGFPADAALDDGTILSGVVVTAQGRSVRQFQNFVRNAQAKLSLAELEIQADTKAGYDADIKIIPMSPLRLKGEIDTIRMSRYLAQMQTNLEKVVIPLKALGKNIIIGATTLILVTVKNGRTLDFTLRIADVYNADGLFEQIINTKEF